MSTYRLEFITPLFSRGSYEDRPEVRPTSIRGQLHWWFRALGGNATDEKAIFGGIHGGAKASRVVVRVSSVVGTTDSVNTLPHKPPAQASRKAAYQIGTKFNLQILFRLGDLDARLQSTFERTLETWLLLGTLGLRSTRAAGSFRWETVCEIGEPRLKAPADFSAFETRCEELLRNAPLRFALLGRVYSTTEQARRVVSDTLGGSGESIELSVLRWPLGDVADKKARSKDPSRKSRKTSPLRFRIVGFGNSYRIAAVWDARMDVTGNRTEDLQGIIRLLEKKKPDLGKQLAASRLLNK